MNIDKKKELYESEPDKWVVYWKAMIHHEWLKNENPKWNSTQFYQPIAKKDEIVADAVIANPDVEVECYAEGSGWVKDHNFFEEYSPLLRYQLAKPQCDGKFNGGYIKATPEAYDLLIIDINLNTIPITSAIEGHYYIESDVARWVGETNCIAPLLEQFYINNGALSWDEPKGMRLKDFTKPTSANNGGCGNLSITDDYGVCNSCANYLDSLFKNPNCNGCSKNPFYINCFTPIKGQLWVRKRK